jgi:hypothetical protein
MAIAVFNNILKQAQKAGALTNKAIDATQWLRDKAATFRNVDPNRVIKQGMDKSVMQVKTGQLFLFQYDPKMKDKLPYHDRFPLVFPIRRDGAGFYGLNMHYLPVPFRAILMDNLYQLINNYKNDETTRLRLTYSMLANTAKFRYYKPCLKYYLNSQVQSKFIYIAPNEWDLALFLPLHRFHGATAAAVYRDSRKIITGT